jgi:gentisate 1,2-dioxygenase
MAQRNLLDELLKRRDEEREQLKNARPVVKFKDTAWELNRYGKVKWYMHPSIKDTAIRTMLVYVLEIPPGSRSGKIQHQGGIGFFIWAGRGYTIINGKRYDWEQDDILAVPVVPEGVTYQHFNADPANPARLLSASPDVMGPLGVDMGAGLEILEDCPEYKAGG